MDSPLPMTPAHGDNINEETDDSIELEMDSKDDSVVLAQPTIEGLVVPWAPSINDPPAHDVPNSTAQDAPNI